jgi:hypothetical protein
MSMLKEFKEFAMKGNLIDIAVAFVMGGAFGKVTSSFIDGIVMPPINLISGGGQDGKIVLREGVAAISDVAGSSYYACCSRSRYHLWRVYKCRYQLSDCSICYVYGY